MERLEFNDFRNKPVHPIGGGIETGGVRFKSGQTLDFGNGLEPVPVSDLAEVAGYYRELSDDTCHPQLAALVFDVTGQYSALNWYFPITNFLDDAALADFHKLSQYIVQNPGFDLELFGPGLVNLNSRMKADLPFIIAGHLAEIFFYRRDILQVFLSTPRHFWFYCNGKAFAMAGGLAGGDYNHTTEGVQLVLSRVYEGFYGPTPGVAPILHELGHMLDFFDASTGKMGNSEGLLPGLKPSDGAIYTSRARELFLHGKQLEMERYRNRQNNKPDKQTPLPIGHPYVFQNDTEFIAGYLEMFFRNPHYLSSQNPILFNSFVELFQFDPRQAWEVDFPFYVKENRNFYLDSGEKPGDSYLTIPKF